jgi:hypothetical protein
MRQMGESVTETTDAQWYDDRKNLVKLYSFLDAIDCTPDMPNFIEDPAVFEEEWTLMQNNPDWPEYDEEQLEKLAAEL